MDVIGLEPYGFIRFGAMDVTKPCGFMWLGAMDVTKPYEVIGFGAMDVTKPCGFIWFGDIHGPEPYTCIGLRWALISHRYLREFPQYGLRRYAPETRSEQIQLDLFFCICTLSWLR